MKLRGSQDQKSKVITPERRGPFDLSDFQLQQFFDKFKFGPSSVPKMAFLLPQLKSRSEDRKTARLSKMSDQLGREGWSHLATRDRIDGWNGLL